MESAAPFAALIGLDWSDRKHDLCLVDATTGDRELSIIKHTSFAGTATLIRGVGAWVAYTLNRVKISMI